MSDNLRRIRSLETKPDRRLLVFWDDGSQSAVDLSPEIKRGGVFARLTDNEAFHRVRIGPRKRSIEWRDEKGEVVIDIDADALYEKAGRDSFFKNLLRVLHLASPTPAT